jgi:hypothetical protein
VDLRFVMRLNDKGEWVDTGDVKFGDNPPQRTFQMTLHKQNKAERNNFRPTGHELTFRRKEGPQC